MATHTQGDEYVALSPNLDQQRADAAHATMEAERNMTVGQYLASRFTTLKPPMEKLPNPFTTLKLLTRLQWAQFLVAFTSWSWDAFDFFTVSMTVEQLAEEFEVTKTDITWGITLVLMFRSVGAIIFGIASDRWGRRWPFVINNILFIVLELLTGFCTNYTQFLIVRAFFGVAMGGLYGNVAATALEDCPPAARGIISGMLQQGYAFGYLLAVVFARALVDTTPHGWRPLFWFGACPPVLIIIFRLCLPETTVYQERMKLREASKNATATFIAEGKIALKRHWMLLIYMVLLMSGFNFMSHGSQDLYPTLLKSQHGFNADEVTVTMVIAKTGALVGGTIVGYYSQMFGRRLSIIVAATVGAALIYPYSTPSDVSVSIVAFFEMACVQGAWGVIPIHLMELSPPSYSAFIVGTSYQLGNLVSSATSTIESALAEKYPIHSDDGVERHDYGKVIFVLMIIVFVYVILITFLGPEYRNKKFDVANDHDLEDAARLNQEDGEKTPVAHKSRV